MKTMLAGVLALACAATATAQTRWDLPSGYGANTFQVQNLQQFATEVEQLSGGKLRLTLHPGGALYKTPEIKRAVQTGQTQIGEFILSGHANENPLFGVDSVPFLASTYTDARRLYDAARPVQERLLAAQGLKLLFSVPWPGQSLYSVRPVQVPADFAGTKMRTYNPATSRIAQLLKAQPVTIQLAELPQALATGAVHNFLTSSASGVESKLHEQVKHFYPVNAWLPRNVTVVQQRSFDALDKATQDAVLKAAASAEARGWAASERLDSDYVRELAARGMSVSEPSESVRKALTDIGQTMVEEWLKSAGSDGQSVLDAYRKRP